MFVCECLHPFMLISEGPRPGLYMSHVNGRTHATLVSDVFKFGSFF